MKKEKRC